VSESRSSSGWRLAAVGRIASWASWAFLLGLPKKFGFSGRYLAP
jgi:hypothetical protein